ncbi:peptidase M20 [Sphingomonas oleivorans]|uniref:Peptidase M20 n=1 Tax=Sphingomonas oleivorans TaxID=1735121 RepID=A0A2T5G0H4_9SPHN|nr:amidohydrolase [Sphingomonas oleivorans]PTQ12644.1 peptidase M20 [Sphingomonas oleivorans]
MRPLIALSLLLAATPAAAADPLRDAIKADMPDLLAIYRDFHANPELSFQETRSAAKLAAEARKLGFEVTTGVGRTGVVAVMRNGPGPVVLLRADMDGLPVPEQTGLAYASKAKSLTREGAETPVMHACGHDTHMTAWIGTARRLAAMKDQWSGTLVMIGQPAEEIGSGARAMLADGLYTRFPKPSTVIAFHDSAQLPAGTVGYADGYAMANVDSVDLVVKGVGGHGAYPHLAKDPIVLAARIVTALQTLVAREVDPLESGVVTVGSFIAGAKHNIIPDEARLQLTVRSYTPEVRKILLDGIARIAKGEALAAGMPEDRLPVVTIKDEYTPATFNTQPFTGQVADLFVRRFGKDRVVVTRAQMGGEDFSQLYLADKSVQSLLFWVGGVPHDKWQAAQGDITKLPSIHSPFWAPDAEGVVGTATEAMTSAALAVLAKK